MPIMGNRFAKYMNFISWSRNRDIVSERSLQAVGEIVAYLKLNVRNRQVFHATGYQRRVRQIAAYINAGTDGLHDILMERSPVEVAAGLQYFLVRLPKPLLPFYIQTLALDINEEIQPEMVAADILGLIRQDITGRHLQLIATLLDLLFFVRKHAISDELAGSDIPITMLPVFFHLQPQHFPKWRTIASVFMEMVDLSPAFLPVNNNSDTESEVIPDTGNNGLFAPLDEHHEVQRRVLGDNVVLHQFLMRAGHNGDPVFPEIVNIIQNRTIPPLVNPVFGYLRRF